MLDGDTATYVIEDGTAWETGTATAGTTATVFTRELSASSTGSLLSLTGSATMYFTPNAADMSELSRFGRMLAVSVGQVSL